MSHHKIQIREGKDRFDLKVVTYYVISHTFHSNL